MRILLVASLSVLLSACMAQDRMELVIHDDKYVLDGVDLATANDARMRVLETKPKLLMVLACPGVDKKRIMEIVDPLRNTFSGELVYSKKRSGCS